MELYGNPALPFDHTNTQVQRVPGGVYRPSHMVHIDSRNRDTLSFRNPAEFDIRLQKPLRGVYSVELINAQIPVVWRYEDNGGTARDITHMTDGHIFMQIDGLEDYEINYPAQLSTADVTNINAPLGTFIPPQPATQLPLSSLTATNVSSGQSEVTPPSIQVPRPNNTNPAHLGVARQSFAKLDLRDVRLAVPYSVNPSATVTPVAPGLGPQPVDMLFWRRSEMRCIKRFTPLKDRVQQLRVRLVDRFGNLLYSRGAENFATAGGPLPDPAPGVAPPFPVVFDGDWYCTLEVVAQN